MPPTGPETNGSSLLEDVSDEQRAYFGAELSDIDLDDDLEAADRGDDPSAQAAEKEEEPAKEEAAEKEEEPTKEEAAEKEEEPAKEEAAEKEEEPVKEEAAEKEEEPKKEEAKDDKASEPRIPKARFDQVNEARKAALAELEQLKSQQKAAEDASKNEYDFDAAEREYMDLVLDGKADEAVAKRKEIRAAEQAEVEAAAEKRAVSSVEQRNAQNTIQNYVQQAERTYPVFDEGHEDYDEALVRRVQTYYAGYSRELPAPDAFIAALDDVIRMNGLDERYGVNQKPAKETPAEETPAKPEPIKKTAEKIETAKKQPAPISQAGQPSGTTGQTNLDIHSMSDEELEALPPATLARLRGDVM